MKKILIAIVAVFAMSTAANAQIQDLGIRFGGGSAFGGEVSAMWGMGSNRLETDLGWSNYGGYINLSGIYQWVMPLPGEFGWFAGVGANLGLYTSANNFGLGICGQIGLEWNPSALPLQFTLDLRPSFNILGYASGFGYGGAIGIRYRF